MFHPQVPLLETAARTLIIYFVVFIGLRVTGKREVGQMTPFDLVVILLVANAVQNAMVGADSSVTGGIVATVVLLVANYAIVIAREHVPWLRRAAEGSPTYLIRDGRFIDAALHREHVDVDEVLMAIREHGIDDPLRVREATLETDGSISVVPEDDDDALKTRRRIRQRRQG